MNKKIVCLNRRWQHQKTLPLICAEDGQTTQNKPKMTVDNSSFIEDILFKSCDDFALPNESQRASLAAFLADAPVSEMRSTDEMLPVILEFCETENIEDEDLIEGNLISLSCSFLNIEFCACRHSPIIERQ